MFFNMAESETGVLSTVGAIFNDILYSPLNLALLVICVYLVYKFFFKRDPDPGPPPQPELPKLKQRDFTVHQLREYDGKGKDGRILVAVNGKCFDVTRGINFYGPEGPYGAFAGHDASRGLATFSLTEDCIKDEYDDISDLSSMQLDSMHEWEMQFTEKYDYIGKLLKPGEAATEYYTDTEDDPGTEAGKVKAS